MTAPPVRRLRLLKVLAISAGILTVVVLAVVLWIDRVADRRTAEMERGLDDLRTRVAAIDAAQAVLREGSEPGNAWDDYLTAFREIGKLGASNKIPLLVGRLADADEEFGKSLIATHGAIVDHLVRGANRRSCVYPRTDMDYPYENVHYTTTWQFAILKARSLSRDGKDLEAIKVLCAASALARDYADTTPRNSLASGFSAMSHVLDELRESLASLSPEALHVLDRHLAALDRAFPRQERALLLKSLWELTGTDDEPLPLEMRLNTWRYGFSDRILKAAAAEHSMYFMKRMAATESLDWMSANAELRKIDVEMTERYRRELIWYGWYGSGTSTADQPPRTRNIQAHLRLLRAAAHYRATGEVLSLADPLGDKIHHSLSEGRLRVWSNGSNGHDDGGKGEWGKQGRSFIESGLDIVLEVPR